MPTITAVGGIAPIVWDNGGQVGILGNDAIMAAHAIYEASLQSEMRGRGRGMAGARSIKWDRLEVVDHANVAGVVCLDWLKLNWNPCT